MDEFQKVALTEGEHMALLAVRGWVGTANGHDEDQQSACQDLATLSRVFRLVGDRYSAQAFDRFMHVLSSHSKCMIDIRRADCKCMSQDELMLLVAFRSAQSEHFIALETLLSKWLPQQTISDAAKALISCFATWKSAGYLLPDCPHCTAIAMRSITHTAPSHLLN